MSRRRWLRRRLARVQARPIPTTLGFLLMLLRVVAGLVFIGLTVVDFRGFLQADVFSQTRRSRRRTRPTATWIVAIFLAVVGLWLLLYLWMAILVYRGSDRARVIAMSLSSLAIIVAAIDFFNGGAQFTLQNNILGLPLDILVVLALSSQRVADVGAPGAQQAGSRARQFSGFFGPDDLSADSSASRKASTDRTASSW